MYGKVKLQNHLGNNVVVQLLNIIEGEVPQLFMKVHRPLTHDVIRCDHLWLGIVSRALNNNIVDIGIPKNI